MLTSKSKSSMRIGLFMLAVLGAGAAGLAQSSSAQAYPSRNSSQTDDSYSSKTTAIDERESRAEQEAERLVSLPAERIIVLLEREPGLFLQVKKVLVRKAYQEGRVLDPKELTDEEVFRKIREDENVRVWVTHEIVDRNYVRVKPSQKEVAEWQRRSMNARGNVASGSYGAYGTNQEDEYWSHPSNPTPSQPQSTPSGSYGRPNMPSPQDVPPDDPRRKILQAQAQARTRAVVCPSMYWVVTRLQTLPQIS